MPGLAGVSWFQIQEIVALYFLYLKPAGVSWFQIQEIESNYSHLEGASLATKLNAHFLILSIEHHEGELFSMCGI